MNECNHSGAARFPIGWVCPGCAQLEFTIQGVTIRGELYPSTEDDCEHMTTIAIPGGILKAQLCLTCGKLELNIAGMPLIARLYEVDELHRALIDKLGELYGREFQP